MQYKLLVSDMDGTLLDSKDKISKSTSDVISRAMEKGLYFTFATGRSLIGIKTALKGSGLWPNAPIATFNGAKIINPDDETTLYERLLEKETAVEILAFCKKLGAAAVVWSEGKLYISEENERTKHYSGKTGLEAILIQDEDELISRNISKIICQDEPEKIEYYITQLQGKLKGNVTFCTSSADFLEFFHSDASKGGATAYMAKRLGISPHEIIAVGDQRNDISMLKFAGLGVAMGNALDELKAEADYIAPSNDEDGLAFVIEKFILRQTN